MNTFFNHPRLYFLTFFLTVLCFAQTTVAQKEADSLPRYTQEWKLNAFNLLVFQALEISFEKYVNDKSSFGFTGLLSLRGGNRFDGETPFYYEDFALSGFYRIYLGQEANRGLFVETFGSFSSGNKHLYEDVNPSNPYNAEDSFTELGLGFAIGGKFIPKEKYSLSLIAGVARNFLSDDGPALIPRVGINFGKRF